MVSRGSRASGVSLRTPPTGSAPPHVGSPLPRDYHHCFVVVCVCVGGVDAGGPRAGEPRVPGVRGLTQGSLDRIRTHTRRLTTPTRLSPLFRGGVCVGVGGWVGGGGGHEGRGGEPRGPGVRGHVQASLDRIRTHTRRLTTSPRLSPLFRGGVCVGVGGSVLWWGVCGWMQGVPAVVSRGSRASGVTIGTPSTGSAPTRKTHWQPRNHDFWYFFFQKKMPSALSLLIVYSSF